jgi:hypothetical protein
VYMVGLFQKCIVCSKFRYILLDLTLK